MTTPATVTVTLPGMKYCCTPAISCVAAACSCELFSVSLLMGNSFCDVIPRVPSGAEHVVLDPHRKEFARSRFPGSNRPSSVDSCDACPRNRGAPVLCRGRTGLVSRGNWSCLEGGQVLCRERTGLVSREDRSCVEREQVLSRERTGLVSREDRSCLDRGQVLCRGGTGPVSRGSRSCLEGGPVLSRE